MIADRCITTFLKHDFVYGCDGIEDKSVDNINEMIHRVYMICVAEIKWVLEQDRKTRASSYEKLQKFASSIFEENFLSRCHYVGSDMDESNEIYRQNNYKEMIAYYSYVIIKMGSKCTLNSFIRLSGNLVETKSIFLSWIVKAGIYELANAFPKAISKSLRRWKYMVKASLEEIGRIYKKNYNLRSTVYYDFIRDYSQSKSKRYCMVNEDRDRIKEELNEKSEGEHNEDEVYDKDGEEESNGECDGEFNEINKKEYNEEYNEENEDEDYEANEEEYNEEWNKECKEEGNKEYEEESDGKCNKHCEILCNEDGECKETGAVEFTEEDGEKYNEECKKECKEEKICDEYDIHKRYIRNVHRRLCYESLIKDQYAEEDFIYYDDDDDDDDEESSDEEYTDIEYPDVEFTDEFKGQSPIKYENVSDSECELNRARICPCFGNKEPDVYYRCKRDIQEFDIVYCEHGHYTRNTELSKMGTECDDYNYVDYRRTYLTKLSDVYEEPDVRNDLNVVFGLNFVGESIFAGMDYDEEYKYLCKHHADIHSAETVKSTDSSYYNFPGM